MQHAHPANLLRAGLDANKNPRAGQTTTYYNMRLPQGIAGTLEAITIPAGRDHDRWDNWINSKMRHLLGNRSITGRIYAPIQRIPNNNSDFSGGAS